MAQDTTVDYEDWLRIANAAGLGGVDAWNLSQFYTTTSTRLTSLELGDPSEANLGYYDVRAYGIVADNTSVGDANTTALQTLIDTVAAAGGGEIYFPAGKYYLNSRIGVGDNNLASIRFQGDNGITLRGAGVSSKLVWQGDLQSTAKHFIWISGGYVGAVTEGIVRVTTKDITFQDLWIGIGDITNRDTGSEQNHLIRVASDQRGDVENIRIINCTFGLTGGDAVFLSGDGGANNGNQISWASGILITGCKFDGYQHAAAVAPTYGYRTCIAQKQNTRRVLVTNNYFTGSDDALMDLEPTGGTTPNGNDDLVIMGNSFVVSAPSGVATAAISCVQMSGNGNVDGDLVQGVVFANNTIKGGRIFGIRLWRVHITNNHIYCDTGVTSPLAAINIITRHNALEIVGNSIYAQAGFTGNCLISVDHDNYLASQRGYCLIADNYLEYVDLDTGTVVNLESVDVNMHNNKIVSKKATSNVGSAVVFNSISNDCTATIRNNQITGDFGGGSLQYGIVFGPNTKQLVADASHNTGTGIGTAGVRFTAGSGGGGYAQIPVAIGNSLPGGVQHADSNGFWLVGGNNGSVTHTVSGNVTPEGLVTAVQGSRHVRRNGDSTAEYRKTSGTGNTGWVTP